MRVGKKKKHVDYIYYLWSYELSYGAVQSWLLQVGNIAIHSIRCTLLLHVLSGLSVCLLDTRVSPVKSWTDQNVLIADLGDVSRARQILDSGFQHYSQEDSSDAAFRYHYCSKLLLHV